jgi:hypothetical protein
MFKYIHNLSLDSISNITESSDEIISDLSKFINIEINKLKNYFQTLSNSIYKLILNRIYSNEKI